MAENEVPRNEQDSKGTDDAFGASIVALELAGGLRLLSSYVEWNDPAEMNKEGMRCIIDLLTQKASKLAEGLEDAGISLRKARDAALSTRTKDTTE